MPRKKKQKRVIENYREPGTNFIGTKTVWSKNGEDYKSKVKAKDEFGRTYKEKINARTGRASVKEKDDPAVSSYKSKMTFKDGVKRKYSRGYGSDQWVTKWDKSGEMTKDADRNIKRENRKGSNPQHSLPMKNKSIDKLTKNRRK